MPSITYYPTTQTIKQGVYGKTTYKGAETYKFTWDSVNRKITKLTFSYDWSALPDWFLEQVDYHTLYMCDTNENVLAQSSFVTIYDSISETLSETTNSEAFDYIVNLIQTKGSFTIKHIDKNPTIHTSGSTKISENYFNFTAISLTITYEYINTISYGIDDTWKPCIVYYGANNKWVKCKPFICRGLTPENITFTSSDWSNRNLYTQPAIALSETVEANENTEITITTTTKTYSHFTRVSMVAYDANGKSINVFGTGITSISSATPKTITKNLNSLAEGKIASVRLYCLLKDKSTTLTPAELYNQSGITITLDRSMKWHETH